jgi:hypothetical protein
MKFSTSLRSIPVAASHQRWHPINQVPPPKYEFVTVRRFHDGLPFRARLTDRFWRDEGGLIVKEDGLQWLMPS